MPAPSAEQERFPALDGLRALAITVVVFHHSGAAGAFFDRGLGVNTLFAISGFLVTWLLLREHDRTGTIATGQFHLRRALRILPLYYAMLLVYVGATAVLEPRSPAGLEFWENLSRFATLTASGVNVRGDERVIFVFAWSVSTQERLYLVWPWIVRLVKGRIPLVLAVAGLFSLVPTPFLPPGQATALWMGACLACLQRHERGAALLRAVAGGWWSVPVALAGVLAPAVWPGAPQVATVASLAYLVAACVVRPGVLEPLLVNAVARHLGRVSFGIYLTHKLCLKAVALLTPKAWPLLTFALALPLCVLVATLSERVFETPLRRRGMRLLAPSPARQPAQPQRATEELEPVLPSAAAVG